MTMRSLSLELIVFFPTSCVGINLGKKPRGLRHPWLIPPHSVAKHYTNSLCSCIVSLQQQHQVHACIHPSVAGAGGGVKRRFYPDLGHGAPAFCITTAQCHTESQSQLLDAPRTMSWRTTNAAEYVSSRVRQMKAPTPSLSSLSSLAPEAQTPHSWFLKSLLFQ